jgi:hypothetical protein
MVFHFPMRQDLDDNNSMPTFSQTRKLQTQCSFLLGHTDSTQTHDPILPKGFPGLCIKMMHTAIY